MNPNWGIEVIDNFVSPSYLKEIGQSLDPQLMQWHFRESQSLSKTPSLEDFGFAIGLCGDGSRYQPKGFYDTKICTFMRPLIYQIKDYIGASTIVRSRLDLTILHKQKYIHPPHTDISYKQSIEKNYVSAIVYINDTDGDTVIYDHNAPPPYPTNMKIKKTIAPKPGRLLLFDARYVHTGHSPSEHQTRILLNTVLL